MQEELDNPILEPSDKFYASSSDKTEVPEEVAVVAEVVVEKAPEETVVESEEPGVSASTTEEDAGSFVYEIGEREITQEQILEWEQGYLRQSDYTQKTQGVAKKVDEKVAKEVSKRIGDLDTKASALVEHATTLSAMLDEVEGSVDLEALREDDYEEYQKTKETIDGRREKVKKVAEEANKARDEAFTARVKEQQILLYEAKPDWTDADGKPTTKRMEDFKLINDYAQEVGYTAEEFGSMSNHLDQLTLLEAAKYRQLKKKTVEAKVKKDAPKLVKPTKQKSTKTDTQSPGDRFYANAKG